MKDFSLKRALAAAFCALFLVMILAPGVFAAQIPEKSQESHATKKTQIAATGCSSHLIPQLAWHEWLEVQYVTAPQYVDLYQNEPVYGSQYPQVAVWRSTDRGKTFSYLGQYTPSFSDYDNLIYYSSGNIPFACVTSNWYVTIVS